MFAHIDADAFFASVLQRKYPRLKGKSLLALGMGGGCVIAASYEAKAKGVKTGMRLANARKLAPDAISLPADFRATYDATRQLFALFEKFCPGGVEEASPDEGYLDLTHACRGVARYAPTRCSKDVCHMHMLPPKALSFMPDPFNGFPSAERGELHPCDYKPFSFCAFAFCFAFSS